MRKCDKSAKLHNLYMNHTYNTSIRHVSFHIDAFKHFDWFREIQQFPMFLLWRQQPSNNFRWYAVWRNKHSIAEYFRRNIRRWNVCVKQRTFESIDRSIGGVACKQNVSLLSNSMHQIGKYRLFFSILMYGETKTLIWTQPRRKHNNFRLPPNRL